MKLSLLGQLMVGAVLMPTPLLAQQTFRTASTCEMLVSGQPSEWRASQTQGITSQPVRTSVERELWLQKSQKAMLDFLYGDTDTPEMVFAQEEGVSALVSQQAVTNPSKNTIPLNYTTDVAQLGFHYERVPRIEVSGLGASGILRGTLLLPVSGHTGIPNAEKWSKTDTYDVRLNDGTKETTLVSKSPSLGMITAQDLDFQMKPGQVYKLLYYRSGSGGPSGYSDGRTYEIVWDGK